MSISQLFPEEGPTLNLNFAGSKTLDPRITFSRTTTGTYMGSDGLIKVAPADAPRFDHRYVNGEIESLGLLVEESRSNLATYSNGLSSWGSAYSHTLNQDVVGPDGITNSAWTMDDTYTGGDGAFREKSFSVTPSTNQYCFSVFAKSGTAIWFDMYAFFIGSSTRAVYLNYVWGTNTLSVGSAENSPPAPTIYGKIEYPNGWNRFYFVFSDPTGLNNTCLFRLYPSSRNAGYVGSTLFYGAQIEAGAFPTSYIPRPDASTATRTADTPQITGNNLSSWFNPNQGTFIINHRWNTLNTFVDALFAVSTNGGGSGINLYDITSSAYGAGLEYPGTNNFQKITEVGSYKYGLTYDSSSRATLKDGGTVIEDANAFTSLNTVNRFSIGMDRGNNWHGSKTISQLTYYPTRLTNTQLQTLTK